MIRRARALRRGPLTLAVAAAATLSLVSTTAATAAVVHSEDAVALGNAMSAAPVAGTTSLLVNYDCESGLACPTGISDTPLVGFPTSGGNYGILTSGDAALADDANSSGSSGDSVPAAAPGPIANVEDQQVLKVDLPAATGTCLAFDFRFLSEEFPEFVNQGFNDAFVAQLDTLNVAVDPAAQTVNAPGDFAAGAGDRISVDAAGPSAMSPAEAAGTTYDGATLRLVARTAVAPGSVHSLYLTIFDQGDSAYDSAVFVDNIRFENIDPAKCKSLALDPFEGTTGVELIAGNPPAFNAAKTAINIPVTCNLPPGPIGCPIAANVSFVNWGDALPARKATTPLAAGSATIPAGAAGTIVAATNPTGLKAVKAVQTLPKKLKKKAKKLLKKAKKLRAQAEDAAPARAAKLLKKAKKLVKKAKKLKKRARKLLKQPLGTMSIRLTNTSNGASMVRNVTMRR
jgi:hypothetical protein